MGNAQAGVDAELFGLFDRFLRGAEPFDLILQRPQGRVVRGERQSERVIGGDGDEARPKQGVGAGREHLNAGGGGVRGDCSGAGRGEGKAQLRALAFADPIGLHQPDFVGPAVKTLQSGEQVLGKSGDFEEPLLELAGFNQRAGTPAAPIDDLFIGEHGLVDRVPIDLGFAPVSEAIFPEFQEDILLVAVILRRTGGDLAVPVDGKAEQFELAFHHRNIVIGPGGWVGLALDRGVFGRQAKSVPAHRVQNPVAAGAFVAGDDVAHGVIARMADMDAARGVGKHLERVIFRAPVAVVVFGLV